MNDLYTPATSETCSDPAKRRDYHRARYLANRDAILAAANARKRTRTAAEAEAACFIDTDTRHIDPDELADTRPLLERDRREVMEGIRLRLIWASSAGGDEGTVAKTAVAVIRFAEAEGVRWTDRALRGLHRRLSLAEGLTPARFDAARETLAKELFVPL